jgi:glycosyltransferase involved in cell wall biosynthesis
MPMLNASRDLRTALNSLVHQRVYCDWELIVADNGSTDDSREIVESYRDRLPGLTIVDASERAGRSYAVNKGVGASRGRSVVFFDSDDVLAPGYLLAMSRALRAETLVCARRDVVGLNSRRTWERRPSSQMDGPMNFFSFLPWGGGGTLGLSRSLFDAMGGFDLSIQYLEDIDLCWRAQLDHGARLAFVPGAVLRHRYRDDVRGVFHQTRRWSRDEAKLREIYEERGMPPSERGILRGLWSLRHVELLREPAGRFFWFKRLGHVVGRAEGRLRTLPAVGPALAERHRPRDLSEPLVLGRG